MSSSLVCRFFVRVPPPPPGPLQTGFLGFNRACSFFLLFSLPMGQLSFVLARVLSRLGDGVRFLLPYPCAGSAFLVLGVSSFVV